MYGSGASAPHRLHLWPREEPWTGGGRGGPGLMRAWGQWAMKLLQCTASLLGAMGSETPAIHCLNA